MRPTVLRLAIVVAILAVGLPASAGATVRSVSVEVQPPAPPAQLGQPDQPAPPPYTMSFAYNDATGTVIVAENGRGTFTSTDANDNPISAPMWPGFGDGINGASGISVQMSHCASTPGASSPDLSLYLEDGFDPRIIEGFDDNGLALYNPDPNGFPYYSLQDSVLGGQLLDTSSISSDASTVAFTWSDPTHLAGLNLTCAYVGRHTVGRAACRSTRTRSAATWDTTPCSRCPTGVNTSERLPTERTTPDDHRRYDSIFCGAIRTSCVRRLSVDPDCSGAAARTRFERG